jgi:hypothetical protein
MLRFLENSVNAAVHINSLRVLDRNFDTVTIAWNLGVSVAIPTPPRGAESSFPDSIGCLSLGAALAD